MEVLLKKEVKNLGKEGQIVKVKDGFFRNYLFPKDLAVPANPKNLKLFEQRRQVEAKKLEKAKKLASEVADKLKKISCTIVKHAGEEDKLFGSVTSADIAESLENEGFKIDKKDVLIEEPLKKLGIYEVPVKVHPEITVEVKIWVVKEKD